MYKKLRKIKPIGAQNELSLNFLVKDLATLNKHIKPTNLIIPLDILYESKSSVGGEIIFK